MLCDMQIQSTWTRFDLRLRTRDFYGLSKHLTRQRRTRARRTDSVQFVAAMSSVTASDGNQVASGQNGSTLIANRPLQVFPLPFPSEFGFVFGWPSFN